MEKCAAADDAGCRDGLRGARIAFGDGPISTVAGSERIGYQPHRIPDAGLLAGVVGSVADVAPKHP